MIHANEMRFPSSYDDRAASFLVADAFSFTIEKIVRTQTRFEHLLR
jgi:hypothetical protein